ncbi:uncharacterized protein LOC123668412 [Melitaea cinxia]|uniref:uncharacterized protein LOC123668412 n=2 Tax=Melitaea cinxia TaxID=113334 RepID=UPI001E26E971|nr:uncharacterized protein LOC123668412 [Melitaea cinxia]
MAQQLIMKSRSLGKDEVMSLLDLISKHNIITTKATNATNNKLKEEAWKSIAHEFSAMTGEIKRPEQLRLKWENLKKAARKRNALIRQNNIKTGGGKTYIPPDEALDRVASMLGASCTGFTVEFGGDREELVEIQNVEILDVQPDETNKDENEVVGSLEAVGHLKHTPKKFVFNTPKSGQNKKRKLSQELQRAQCDKEQAMAAYFRAKAKKVELETIKLQLEIEQLKNSVK